MSPFSDPGTTSCMTAMAVAPPSFEKTITNSNQPTQPRRIKRDWIRPRGGLGPCKGALFIREFLIKMPVRSFVSALSLLRVRVGLTLVLLFVRLTNFDLDVREDLPRLIFNSGRTSLPTIGEPPHNLSNSCEINGRPIQSGPIQS